MSISTIAGAQSRKSNWDLFTEWVTSTNNRLYVGWFGVLDDPLRCSQQPSVLLLAFVGSTTGRYRWHPRTSVAGSLLYGETILSQAQSYPAANAIGLASSTRFGKPATLDEWLYNGGPFQLVIFHFLLSVSTLTWDANGNLVID